MWQQRRKKSMMGWNHLPPPSWALWSVNRALANTFSHLTRSADANFCVYFLFNAAQNSFYRVANRVTVDRPLKETADSLKIYQKLCSIRG